MDAVEIYRIVDGLVPKAISDEYCAVYGAYDNSGLLLNVGREVKAIVFSLDLSKGAIALAKEKGANLIVTHHPAIYGKLSSLSVEQPVERKLLECAREEISVISMHLNLDCAEGGIDDSLVDAFGGKTLRVMEKLTKGGYGKLSAVEKQPFEAFVRSLNTTLETDRTVTYGKRDVSLVASFCGAGVSEGALSFAKENGADTVLSSDWKHHLIALCQDYGMNAVCITHYASESYGFRKFVNKCQAALPAPCFLHEDGLK